MNKHQMQLEVLKLTEQGLMIQKTCAMISDLTGFQEYKNWMTEVSLFGKRYLSDHPLYKELEQAYFFRNSKEKGLVEMTGLLSVIGNDKMYWQEKASRPYTEEEPISHEVLSKTTDITPVEGDVGAKPIKVAESVRGSEKMCAEKVFIVHEHDNEALIDTARTIEKLGLRAIILHEQPDAGKTIIEKIEANSDVVFAVILYTECDLGRERHAPESSERFRARQNVVFEHGYLIGKLGRDRVCAMIRGNVETPGDISGVVYTEMDQKGAWKMQLVKNMKAVGVNVDVDGII